MLARRPSVVLWFCLPAAMLDTCRQSHLLRTHLTCRPSCPLLLHHLLHMPLHTPLWPSCAIVCVLNTQWGWQLCVASVPSPVGRPVRSLVCTASAVATCCLLTAFGLSVSLGAKARSCRWYYLLHRHVLLWCQPPLHGVFYGRHRGISSTQGRLI